jgi:hypothetical protein
LKKELGTLGLRAFAELMSRIRFYLQVSTERTNSTDTYPFYDKESEIRSVVQFSSVQEIVQIETNN